MLDLGLSQCLKKVTIKNGIALIAQSTRPRIRPTMRPRGRNILKKRCKVKQYLKSKNTKIFYKLENPKTRSGLDALKPLIGIREDELSKKMFMLISD